MNENTSVKGRGLTYLVTGRDMNTYISDFVFLTVWRQNQFTILISGPVPVPPEPIHVPFNQDDQIYPAFLECFRLSGTLTWRIIRDQRSVGLDLQVFIRITET